MITRRRLLELALPGFALGASPHSLRALGASPAQNVVRLNVWKHSGIGCCGPWIADLVTSGLQVEMEQTRSPTALREDFGIPKDLWGCHTAVMEGYVIEGHVPPVDLQRLLDDRPLIRGLAAIGFLDESGRIKTEGNYDVMAFARGDIRSLYATHECVGYPSDA